jgi:Asp-tRNA(Asn)/Glu-tRNA(Gln) amidotransferase A subunit family amidase
MSPNLQRQCVQSKLPMNELTNHPALHQLSAAQAAEAIRQGQVTSEDIVRSCLERIEQLDPVLRAWVSLDRSLAIETAREMDRGPSRGPLHGVPMGIKDVIDTADYPTQFNSPIYAGRLSGRDAAVVALARGAGLVIIGKTATQEFATRGDAGPTRHPLSALHSPGGSSNGSAVAVASNMVPLALSTQTAGSIVRPASYCGVVGFKPSYGLVDTTGMRLIVPSFDTLGFHTRNAGDAALALKVFGMNGDPLNDSSDTFDTSDTFDAARPLRISICKSAVWCQASSAMREALYASASRLRDHGMQIDEVSLPPDFDELVAAHDTISDFEARQSLAFEWLHHRGGLSAGVQTKLIRGEAVSELIYQKARDLIDNCRRLVDTLFVGRDALLTPAAPDVAPVFSRTETGDSAFSKDWTTLGLPCIALPAPLVSGLPLGLQLVAEPGRDRWLMQIAKQVESAFSPFQSIHSNPSIRKHP